MIKLIVNITSITAEIQPVEKISDHRNRWAILILNGAQMKYMPFKVLNIW